MSKLQDKVAIVTGAGRGIGHSIATALAKKGASVVLAGRTSSELSSLQKSIAGDGGRALAISTDITVETEVAQLIDGALKQYGRIDILINNAGVGVFKKVVDLEPADFDLMWNVNMRGVFLATKAVLPHMLKARAGDIVNIASLAGKNHFVGGAGYAATKWALRGFAGSLMLEVREANIRVATIFPGSVDTGFSSTGKRGDKITQPEDVADAVLFAVTAPRRTMFSEIDVRPTNPK